MEDNLRKVEVGAAEMSERLRKADDDLESSQRDLSGANREVRKLKNELQESLELGIELKKQLQDSKAQRLEIEKRYDTLSTDIENLNDNLEKARSSYLQAVQEKEGLEKLNQELENSKNELARALSDKSALVESLEMEVARVKTNWKESDDRIVEYQSEALLRSMESEKSLEKFKEERIRYETMITELQSNIEDCQRANKVDFTASSEVRRSNFFIRTEGCIVGK